MEKRKTERSFAAPLCFLLLLFAILAARNLFSFCQTDESFYAALVNRLWRGERMLIDEWNSTQFYVPLILPFYGIFIKLTGSTEAVLLYLRFLYLLFALITAVKLFFTILRCGENRLTAVVPAAVVLLFSRGNISGVSYYNLCMLCIVSGYCSFQTSDGFRGLRRTARLIWSGILFAAGVLCNPFLAPFAALCLLWCIISPKYRKKGSWVLTGVVSLALMYLLFLLHGAGWNGIFNNLVHVLDSPEQSSVTENLFSSLTRIASISRYVAIPAVLMSVWWFSGVSEEKKRMVCGPYIALQTLLVGWTAMRSLSGTCCAVVIPMTLAAFPLGLSQWVSGLRTAPLMYLFGMLTATAYMMASNTGMDAGTVGFCISAAAGLWISGSTLKKIGLKAGREKAILCLLALSVLAPMLCQRVVSVYRDASLPELNIRLTQGPAKGLFTTPEHAEQYDAVFTTLKEASEAHPGGKILYAKNLPWAYLATDYGYATSSPWRTYTEDLKIYYSVTPDHQADYICILEPEVGRWESSGMSRNPGNDKPNEMDYNEEFWDSIKTAPIIVRTDYLTIYDVREIWN